VPAPQSVLEKPTVNAKILFFIRIGKIFAFLHYDAKLVNFGINSNQQNTTYFHLTGNYDTLWVAIPGPAVRPIQGWPPERSWGWSGPTLQYPKLIPFLPHFVSPCSSTKFEMLFIRSRRLDLIPGSESIGGRPISNQLAIDRFAITTKSE
jgi:hypothetical protein